MHETRPSPGCPTRVTHSPTVRNPAPVLSLRSLLPAAGLALSLGATLAAGYAAPAAAPASDFEGSIAPLLVRSCVSCHSTADSKGGLDLTNGDAARRGGDSGPVIVSGKPAESYLIRRVRALPKEQGGGTPAIALTAYARAEDRVRSVVAGFQHHVAKPVEPAELIAIVASVARASRPRSF